MTKANFIQVHTLHGYPGVLLNRDDAGLAKRLTYGGAVRTRISSQCLKRHWRVNDGPDAIGNLTNPELSLRSREIVTKCVIEPLENAGHDPEAIEAISEVFQTIVYGQSGDDIRHRQPLLLGTTETVFLANEARKIADTHGGNPAAAKKAAKAWAAQAKQNMKAMREGCNMPGGIAAALFGRMVTSDPEANIDAAVHVAHAFTVHAQEAESDYFTVVDDLDKDNGQTGSGHIGETELTSGLFYGYVVLCTKTLLENLSQDRDTASDIAQRLVKLIATVSPGAKRGSTAPYSYAPWLLVEIGDEQPRSLAEAFRSPCEAENGPAHAHVRDHLEKLDAAYGTNGKRRLLNIDGTSLPGVERLSDLKDITAWVGKALKTGAV